MISDQVQLPDWFFYIIVKQKFSVVLLIYTYELQSTLGRWTFSVTLDMVLSLPLYQQKSTSSVLEFSTVDTMPLFVVFFRGYIAEVDGLGPLVKFAWSTEVQSAIPWMKFTRGYKTWITKTIAPVTELQLTVLLSWLWPESLQRCWTLELG